MITTSIQGINRLVFAFEGSLVPLLVIEIFLNAAY